MKRIAIVYLSALVILCPLDLLFLGTIGRKFFERNVGDMILTTLRVAPAAIFYVLYLAGVAIFVNGVTPSDWAHSLVYGALFGLFCYATFELTNMSLLKHWEWSVVVLDIIWGATLTAISASLGGLLAEWILSKV